MSISVSRIQNVSTTSQNMTFKSKGANFAKKTSEISKNTIDRIGTAGWLLIIGLLVGGWVSSCHDIIQQKRAAASAVELPEVMPSAPADTLDYTL